MNDTQTRIENGTIYLHRWAEYYAWHDLAGRDALIKDFNITPADLQGIDILLASYHDQGYHADAFVLFRKDGKLYEVNASHCSCYGLEDQWEPEETSVKALRHRIEHGNLGDYDHNRFAHELIPLLDRLERTH